MILHICIVNIPDKNSKDMKNTITKKWAHVSLMMQTQKLVSVINPFLNQTSQGINQH
jgi:hypothetical protein